MSDSLHSEAGSTPVAMAKPPGAREFTLRAVLAGMVVAAIMGSSYPYIVLKLGFGPNVSVVAAFFGFLALGIVFRNYTRWENNVVQTAGTSAAQTAFMCVLLAAFDMLRMSNTVEFTLSPTPMQAFAWLTAAGVLGLLLAVPMRQHFVVDEKLTYPDGVAAAETVIVLDSRGSEAKGAMIALALGTVASGAVMFLTLPYSGSWHIPELYANTLFGLAFASMGVGVSGSLLSLGSGMIVGLRIDFSMLVGTILAWVVAPRLLVSSGILTDPLRNDVLRWIMWPATGMLVSSGLTALALRWRLLIKTFQHFSGDAIRSDEFPLRWVGYGVVASLIALLIIQKTIFDLPLWMTLAAVLMSVPLMLVGLRVLGETNWGPISALSNMMQGVFAAVAPGHVVANMAASGTTGTIATQSEAIMQDYKAGHIIGSSPKYLTYAQLMAAPIGAAAVAFMYPLLRDTYGIGGEKGLTSPISAKWAGFAEFLSAGLSALPPGALTFLVIGVVLGIVLTLVEQRWKRYSLSATGMGIGMLVPASAVITMFLGGLAASLWQRVSPRSAEQTITPLASGLIAGEAMVAVVVPLLLLAGVLS